MSRDDIYLLDIAESARLAVQYVEGMTREQFLANRQIQDSVVRRLEVVGEAARRISEDTCGRYPELPWTDMIRMRNVMIHEYDDVDLHIVWDTVQNDLPPLIRQIERIRSTDGTA